MMGKWGIRETLMCVGGVILLCSIVWIMGVRHGQLNEKLAQNAAQIDTSNRVTKADSINSDTARKKSVAADSAVGTIRAKIRVVHDTTFLPSDTPGKVDTVANKTLAHLVYAVDSAKVAHKEEQRLQDILVAGLYHDIALRDTRIKLIESRGTSRISKGFQVGVGYCQTASSRLPCAYVGYGLELRLP